MQLPEIRGDDTATTVAEDHFVVEPQLDKVIAATPPIWSARAMAHPGLLNYLEHLVAALLRIRQ
jgi:hypothetical protein